MIVCDLPPSAPVPKLFSIFAEKLRIDSADSLIRYFIHNNCVESEQQFFVFSFYLVLLLSNHKNESLFIRCLEHKIVMLCLGPAYACSVAICLC